MSQTVTLDDGSIHNFPDEATPEMIYGALGLNGNPSNNNNSGQLGNEEIPSSMAMGNQNLSGPKPVIMNVKPQSENQSSEKNQSVNQSNPPSSGQEYTGEDLARQAGLAGRYLEGVVPKAISGAMDSANAGVNYATGKINKYAGTDISPLPTNYTGYVDQTLDAMGYPNPQTSLEKKVGTASEFAGNAMLGGEGLYNTGKQAVGEAGNLINSNVVQPAKTLVNGAKALTPEELQQASASLKTGVDDVYGKMRANGAVYNPDSIEELRGKVNRALAKSDIIPALRPQTTDAVTQLNAAMDNGDLSLNHLDQYRRLLNGASGEDSAAASSIRKAIDGHVNQTDASDLVNGSPDAVAYLNRGRAEYTRRANFDDVSDILQKSNGDPTKIKNGLNRFMSDPTNTQGMTTQEIASLRRASQTSSGEAMTKMLGKAGFTIIPTGSSGNGVLPYVMSAGKMAGRAGASLVPGGTPLVAAGTVAKAGNTLYGRGLAQNAIDMIRNREMPPLPSGEVSPPNLMLDAPSVKVPPGGFNGPTTSSHSPQKLLPRGDEDTYYQPSGRALTFQPRPDYTTDTQGFTTKTPVGEVTKNPTSAEDLKGVKSADRELNAATGRPRKLLTYQPRPDYIGTDNGIIQKPSGENTNLLGTESGIPIATDAELKAIKNNPYWQSSDFSQTESTGGTVHSPQDWLTLVRNHGKENNITTKDRLTPEKVRQMDRAVQAKKNKKTKYGVNLS